MTARLLLALDYGGTKHMAGIAAVGGDAWLAHSRVTVLPGADAAFDQATMLRMARELLAQVPGTLVAVGVSFGGPVDGRRGLVRLSHHVPGWEEIPLADRLAAEFGVPVAVDNDANVAALGEWRFGAGRGADSLLYVTVSTGVGGGWVLGGRIWGGADGLAGEIGHLPVWPGGAPCPCGRRGCLEAEASGRAIARAARERLAAAPSPPTADVAASPLPTADVAACCVPGQILQDLAGGRLSAITGELVSRAAQAGDPLAQEVLDAAARMLGTGLASALNLMNPTRVVIGGGVIRAGQRWWRIVRETARGLVLLQARVDIAPAALGDDAPLWGAVALAEGVRG